MNSTRRPHVGSGSTRSTDARTSAPRRRSQAQSGTGKEHVRRPNGEGISISLPHLRGHQRACAGRCRPVDDGLLVLDVENDGSDVRRAGLGPHHPVGEHLPQSCPVGPAGEVARFDDPVFQGPDAERIRVQSDTAVFVQDLVPHHVGHAAEFDVDHVGDVLLVDPATRKEVVVPPHPHLVIGVETPPGFDASVRT